MSNGVDRFHWHRVPEASVAVPLILAAPGLLQLLSFRTFYPRREHLVREERRVSMSDVARLAGVSAQAVSRVSDAHCCLAE